ncbi:hypothetical protein RGU70_05840 [Herbaspirillum sp. RTI4]|uniref:hypothetical protein n=1 Tax=Herbaspirillum sp. RTI4 TaxID=3048640 RepID=UPI002AB55D3A|nr:hypothetical protein [Herbaspirillum sp. RTI4]MDY7577840.1 hypothetical protein [Herbaspirillum sp. RTI4]MEA9982458.1 hypothetical protein [Herbaspirillum sp. RTI4]
MFVATHAVPYRHVERPVASSVTPLAAGAASVAGSRLATFYIGSHPGNLPLPSSAEASAPAVGWQWLRGADLDRYRAADVGRRSPLAERLNSGVAERLIAGVASFSDMAAGQGSEKRTVDGVLKFSRLLKAEGAEVPSGSPRWTRHPALDAHV